MAAILSPTDPVFASVVYGLIVLRSGAPDAPTLFQLIALVIVLSIVMHSSTDVPVAHYFRRHVADQQ